MCLMTSAPSPNISDNIALFLLKAAEMLAPIFLKEHIYIFLLISSDCRMTINKCTKAINEKDHISC